ncbi:MAG: LuxR family transcriptional regulator [Flavobacteriaceae bacterium]
MRLKKIVFGFILFLQYSIVAQELPPIQTFMPELYGAEDQNWSIDQGSDESIYFANNKGLLMYNGTKWRIYNSSNGSIIRSVKVIQDQIYTGSYMDFGFWEKDEYGALKYTSLVARKDLELMEDEEFWNILKLEHWLLFQSLDRIYIYDTRSETFHVINSKTTITKIFKVDASIYFQKINQGIFKFENGKETLVTNHINVRDRIVINIFDEGNNLLFQTKEDGLFIQKKSQVVPWDSNLNLKLSKYSVYSSIRLKNGAYLLGTVSNGVIYINSGKKITYQINQSMGLGNNTVLSLFEDKNKNVWLGLDHGINNINFNAPFKVYKDNLGVLGTVYTTLANNNILYIGTNQGLFYKEQNTKDIFKFIEGTEGQVWSLSKLKNTIFCGHDKGTFIITNKIAKRISSETGTWKIKEIKNRPNLMLQGNYNGLYVLEKKNNTWQLRNKLKGFDISSRYIEFTDSNELLVSHEHKGVYLLKIDADFRRITSFVKTKIHKSIKSSLSNYNGKVVYGTNQGVYYYNTRIRDFSKDSILSKLYLSKVYSSGKLVTTNNKLFTFTGNNIAYAQQGKLSSDYQILQLPLPNSVRQTKDGFENILYLDNDKYLIGTTRGYIIADLEKRNQTKYQIKLDEISKNSINGISQSLSLISKEPELKNNENHIKVSFSVSNFSKYLPTLYQYRLAGFNNNWSDWSAKSTVFFENLPHGEYTFEAKAKVGNAETNNTIRYRFFIEKPWYLKPSAVILYFFFGFLVVVSIHLLNRRYYKNQRKKLLLQKEKEFEIKQLENDQQLMHFKNLDLQRDIEIKNRELGMSAMNLIKRNELLSTIKKELSATDSTEDLHKVVKLINKNLNTNDDWKLFEEAFNNTDKDFIKKLKSKHTKLTSNDLRLCTYLRLNLSSKEIAPLLNISLRSVEVKRYRLRKKMNLPHETSLSNYILKL